MQRYRHTRKAGLLGAGEGLDPVVHEWIDRPISVRRHLSDAIRQLGQTEQDGGVCVGRSDDNLNARLRRWVDSKYSCFTFEYCSSPNAAFVKECTLYHHLGGSEKLGNKTHPQGSANSD